VRAGLLHLPELDAHLAKVISSGRSGTATEFAMHLVRQCCVVDAVMTASQLYNTLDMLAKLAVRNSGGAALLQLVEQARQAAR
jgi:CCR4-NOT transcription complex subunit 1